MENGLFTPSETLMELSMFGKNRAWRIVLGPLALAMLALLLAACGPAVAPSDGAEPASASTENTLSVLGGEGSEGQSATPVPTEATVQGTAGETSTSGSDIQQASDVSDSGSSAADSLEFDQYGLQVGYTRDGHAYRGDPRAPVVIQEYSDYQCPYCYRFYFQTLPDLLKDEIASGDAVLVYYDFPLSNIHHQASAAANAARCAGEQGAAAYWAMHDLLFSNIEEWSASDDASVYSAYARSANLDVEAFQSCVAQNRYAANVQADLSSGQSKGVTGTPTFFLNGQQLVGAQPLENFVSAIETVKNGGQIAGAQPQQQAPAAAPTPAAFTNEFAAAMGDPGAPVTIVEFTDYQCPYCSRHSLQTLPSIVSELVETGRVYYILKDLPLDQLHPNARAAAEAARCAGDQDAYWAMHDQLFSSQSEWAEKGEATGELFVAFARDLGLDEAQMADCLESGRFKDAVEANVAEARALGVASTPMFFIDGYPLDGARPFQHFQLAVQYAEEGILGDLYAPRDAQGQQPEAVQAPANIEVGDAFAIGDPDAPITIIEFTDFQCPYCSRHFQQTYPQIVNEYVETGVVRYVFKDFPLSNIHSQAAKAAEAARCAGEQDAFLQMHDLLFQHQSQWSGQTPTTLFAGYAEDLGLDSGAFEECLSSGKYGDAINADLNEGVQHGVTGTPAFFINGNLLVGAQPFSVFQQYVSALLAAQES
jgi:protein-disulfide isomerase